MKDNQGKVLYVGKAKNIRNRVRNHFGAPPSSFADQVQNVEYIAADNEGEALLLEYNLIKKYNPPCNIRLKDDKRYPYIKLTMGEKYPRAYMTRVLKEDSSYYFGPYPNVKAARLVLNAVKEIFPYRSCKYKSRQFPLGRPCIEYDMKRCVAPCVGLVTDEEYRQLCQEVARFLRGQQGEVRRAIMQRMEQASERMSYERAATYRDILRAMDELSEQQVISTMQRRGNLTAESEDYLALSKCGDIISMVVLKKRLGKVVSSEYYFLDTPDESQGTEEAKDEAFFEAFIPQYYSRVSDLPRKIYARPRLDMKEALETFVSSIAGFKAELRRPQRGTKRKTLDMAQKNSDLRAQEQFKKIHGVKGKVAPGVEQLQRLLHLTTPPLRIEGYDISNIAGTDAVGAMVVFQGGQPLRSGYRKFRIKKVEGIDDYEMMREMLRRRIGRQEDERFGPWPDLILIDGGLGHLTAAATVFDQNGVGKTPLISIAKQEEEVFTRGDKKPLRLPQNSDALKLLQRIRDEAHRFGITYHRTLRSKRLSGSVLEQIEGLGQKRKRALLRHFGSVEAICEATAEEIASVPGISRSLSEKIRAHLGAFS